ncbi:AAA family ATPase [Kocuria palustris]|uniref:helix-turn-helix transcriptional regulator n=1 Tax=Kocuria palustris TaxID=71999 RepID=UPI0011AA26C1|nr:AAA family ATPase [Kocuria palustris]
MPLDPPGRLGDAALTGRDAQLEHLLRLFQEVRRGHPRTAVLTGPVGIGKSRLIRELLDRLPSRGLSVLSASGSDWEADLPLAGYTQLMGSAPLRRPAGFDGGPQPPSRVATRLNHEQTLNYAQTLQTHLESQQRRGPVVVVVDDLQWLDEASLRILIFTARRLHQSKVLLLLAVDLEQSARLPAGVIDHLTSYPTEVLHLPPLDVEAVAALGREIIGADLSMTTAHELLRHTQGHPQSIVELLQEVPAEQWHGWLPALPPSRRMRARVASQLEQASPELVRTAEAVAVLGADAPLHRIAAVAEISHLLPVVDEGHLSGLLHLSTGRRASTVNFVEPSAAAAVYEQIAPTRRIALHRAAASIATDEGERLGHLVSASPGPQELLARRLEAYAQQQAADGVWSEVASAMLSAARLSMDRRDGELRLLRGVDALIGAGDITQASSLVGMVEAMPPSPLRASVLGYLAVVTGRRATAAAQLEMAWRTVREDMDPIDAAGIALRRTLHCLADWDGEGIVSWGERASALVEAPHPVHVESRAMYGLGLYASRRLHEAEGSYVSGLGSTAGNAQEQRLLMGYAWLALRTDDVETARLRFEEAVPTEYRGGSLRVSLWAESWLARCQLVLGDWDAAAATIAHASVRLESSGMRLMRPLLYWTAAELNAMRGDWDRAEHFLSLTAVPADGYRSMTVPAALARARYHEARADYESALEALRPLRAADPVSADREPFWSWQDTLVNSLVMSDQLDEAEEFLGELKSIARPDPFPADAARLAWAEGRLLAARGEVEASQQMYERALDALRSRRRPYLEARIRFAYGQSMRRAGKRRLASRILRSARELYASLGAHTYVARCNRELKASGANALVVAAEQTGPEALSELRRPIPEPAHGGPEPVQLTAQEQAVAQFVAGGSTNKEVAQALFIAEKTVQYHLTRIYAKFGVRSRSELAAVYARDGEGPGRREL